MTYVIQVNLMCIIILATMYFALKRNTVKTSQVNLNMLILVCVIMCVADILAWGYQGSDKPYSYAVLHISNMVYYASITAACYIWRLYVTERVAPHVENPRRFKAITAIPLAIMCLIIIINPWAGWLFTIDSANEYARGSGVVIHWVISYGYLLLSTLLVFRAIRTAETKIRRDELRPMLLFILWPLLASLLQVVFFGLTTMQCGITLGIITITLRNLRSEITTDDLTELNNRGAFDKFTTDRIRLGGKQLISVMMCDIDKFKTINDTFGHSVGDIALINVGKVLRDACKETRSNAFLCRYGGDEFVFCSMGEENDFGKIKDYVTESLSTQEHSRVLPIKLSMSFGTASGVCETYSDFEKLMVAADENMYQNKKLRA